MGSINSLGSTLNSINQSLLTEISSYLSTKKTGNSAATASATAGSASGDTFSFSEVGQLLQELQQLQVTDPNELKQVLSDAANKFSAAAQQTTDPKQASILTNIANKFQTAAQTGDLSTFQQPAASGSTGATSGVQGHHHHHHHHGGGSTEAASSTSSLSTDSSTDPTEDPLATLFS